MVCSLTAGDNPITPAVRQGCTRATQTDAPPPLFPDNFLYPIQESKDGIA